MREKSFPGKLIAVAGMVTIVAIAYGLDRWIVGLRELNEKTQATLNVQILIVQTVASLFVATGLLALTWYVLFMVERSRFVTASFMVAGLILVSLPLLYLSSLGAFLVSLGLGTPLPGQIPGQMVIITGAFLASTGWLSLVPWRGRRITAA